MADRPDEIQLLLTEHGIDASRAGSLACPTGKVLVEMLPAASEIRGILLPDGVAANFRPDVGIVLACGPDVALAPGDMVCVRGYDGQWIEGFSVPGYQTQNQVRVYGKIAPFVGTVERSPWSQSIPISLILEDETMEATNNNLIVRRQAPVKTEGLLELPDDQVYYSGLAVVESIGPRCDLATCAGQVQIGDLIHYDTRGELEFAFGGDPDLAIISDVAVNFSLLENTPEKSIARSLDGR